MTPLRVATALGIIVASVGLMPSSAQALPTPGAVAYPDCSPGTAREMNVIPHHDDDVLFLNPDINRSIKAGNCVSTAYIVASDYHTQGRAAYVEAREAGIRAAYAQMANLPEEQWRQTTMEFGGKPLTVWKLGTQVSLIEFRLPDNGSSYTGAGGEVEPESLKRLYEQGSSVTDFDGRNTFDKKSLTSTIQDAIVQFSPGLVRTLDPSADQHHGDEYLDYHHDHVTVSKLVGDAVTGLPRPVAVNYYRDYPNRYAAQNLSDDEAAEKLSIFRTFAAHDIDICGPTKPTEQCATRGFYHTLNFNQNLANAAAQLPWVPATAGKPGHLVKPTFSHSQLLNQEARLCVTAPGALDDNDLADGHRLVAGSCSTPHFFTLVKGNLKMDKINECVEATGTTRGSAVVVNQCNGRANQQWRYNPATRRFHLAHSGLVITPVGGKFVAGAAMILDRPKYAPAQRMGPGSLLYSTLAESYNTVGVTSSTDPASYTKGNLDGHGNSFSAELMAEGGLVPGASFTAPNDQITYVWPSQAGTGSFDSTSAAGQLIAMTGQGSRLGFLGTGAPGSSGTVTVNYSDGSSSQLPIEFSNWSFDESDIANTAFASAGRNTPTGLANTEYTYRLFSKAVAIDPSKQLKSVRLPDAGGVHIFALSVAP